MLDSPHMKPELRYGCPAADQILINTYYCVGYSYYFRQAKWALELVDPDKEDMTTVERNNSFRPDYRIPTNFRTSLSDYSKSGYDRGHLVASANQNDKEIQNSETFLLSNMSPQAPQFNRQIWRNLESAVRKLDENKKVLKTFVISGPIFSWLQKTNKIGEQDSNGISVPVPSHFYKCILTEEKTGRFKMWAFEMENKRLDGELKDYQVSTAHIEQRAGLLIWEDLKGAPIDREKKKVRRIWNT
ncbi:MAG: DNA/RNA endonuclease G [Gammaproteobacteria bacterium]|nr:MAG: DNA/RNA endonuclease G [Gammaproteobacteria bacterium]